LSIRYGLISRETSYVAIERRETPVLGDVQLRRVPIALTSGWGGLDRGRLHSVVLGGAIPSAMAPASALGRMANIDASPRPSAPVSYSSGPRFPRFSLRRKVRPGMAAPDAAAATPTSRSSGMHALIALQRADGFWDLSKEFAAAIGHDLQLLESALTGASRTPVTKAAWATALALTWLEAHASASRDEWSLLAAKAREWLADVSAVPFNGGTWLEAAEKFLKALPSSV